MSIEIELVDKTVSFTGKRCSGKSVLLRYIVDSCKDKFHKVYIVCPTEQINHFYGSMVEENCIFSEWNESWCETLITKMTEANKGKDKNNRKHVLLILDDCFSDFNFHESKALKKLYTRGRHINIGVVTTTQYLNSLPPVCRNNCDYLSGSIDKPEFVKLYNRSTRDFGFLVINNNSIKENDDLNQIYGIIRCPDEYVV
jgi:hypothetical protein